MKSPPSEFIRGFFCIYYLRIFIPPRLYGPFATCNHYTIPINRLPQRRDSPLFPLPDNMFQMEFFLILLDEESY